MVFAMIIVLTAVNLGCKKLVDVKPPITQLTEGNVYANDPTAIAVLTGIYANVSGNYYYDGDGFFNSLSEYAGLSSDELTLWSGDSDVIPNAYYTNSLSAKYAGGNFWEGAYNNIFTCNAAIAGITASTTLTPAVKNQLLGEAKFMRALFYFYLVNLYGDVALALGTDYKTNAVLARAQKGDVFRQIIADLKDAQGLLSDHFVDASLLKSTTERTRPTKWAATALLARVFLYTGDWADAKTQSTDIINNTGLFALTDLNSTFLMNSQEAIWQLQPVDADITNTQEGALFIIPSTGPSSNGGTGNPVYLSPTQLNAFESGDQRRVNWVDSVTVGTDTYYFPYKYKVNTLFAPVSEYEMVLRLGEQYLIRAEAEANLGDMSSAANDLNTIRARAGLSASTILTSTASQTQAITAILHERQTELFTEWGNRWLDLKRTGQVDNVMSVQTPLKGGTWSSYQQLYPLSLREVQTDVNLRQNPGY